MLYEAKYAELIEYLQVLLPFLIIRNYISNELVDLGFMKMYSEISLIFLVLRELGKLRILLVG